MMSKHFSLYWAAPHQAKEIWWFCNEYNLQKPDFIFFNLNVLILGLWKTLLSCKHIENTNTSFCMHNWAVKNAITWPSIVVDLHTHNFEVLWMRQSKPSKTLLNLIIIIIANTTVKKCTTGFSFKLIFNFENIYRMRQK